ncbi:MAG: ABC transporter ATP-binding protein [Paenibacillaceae bacterium]|nr:ABC transporter ATP-binding protein [Paenibacillaceae bacterium]
MTNAANQTAPAETTGPTGRGEVGIVAWLWPHIKPLLPMLVLSVAVLLLGRLGLVLALSTPKVIIDDVFVPGDYGKLPLILAYLVGSNLLWLCAQMAGLHLMFRNEQALNYSLNADMMERIQHKPMAEIRGERTGTYVSLFTNDLRHAVSMMATAAPRWIQEVAGLLMAVYIVGKGSPLILASVLVFSVFYIMLGKKYGPLLRLMSKEVQGNKAKLVVQIEEGITSTREVVAFNREEWELRRYRSAFRSYFDKVMEEGKLVNRQMLQSDPLRWLANLLVLGYGGYETMQGHMSVGLLVIVYQFSSSLLASTETVYHMTMELSGFMGVVERVRSFVRNDEQKGGGRRLNEPIRSLSLDRVDFSYGAAKRKLFDQLSLNLPLGKKIALVGASGGGKSTILRLLIDFERPASGAVKLNGVPLGEWDASDWRSRICIVFQEPYLLPDTIRVNIAFGRSGIGDEHIEEACRVAHIHEFIAGLDKGYDTVLGERGITLSGGQRQRIALARAIVRNPEVLILDEATSALDLETERKVQAALDERRRGSTTITVAHRLSTVQNADVIYVIEDGEIRERGTHEQLLEGGPIYRKLVAGQLNTR